jgi:hypothetical protein
MNRVIICGSRRWPESVGIRKVIEDRLFELGLEYPDAVIVEGEASGVDRIARQEAQKAGFLIEAHAPDWQAHDRQRDAPVPCNCREGSPHCPRAGHRRNELMASLGANLCIAFWDGRSAGTQDMIERARTHGIPVEIVNPTVQDPPIDESRAP